MQLAEGIADLARRSGVQEMGDGDCSLDQTIAEIWRMVLGKPDLNLDQRFDDLGAGVKRALQIIDKVAETTGVELPISIFCEGITVTKMAHAVRNGGWRSPSGAGLLKEGMPARPPLFFLPGAGGAALELSLLARHLDFAGCIYGLHSASETGTADAVERVAAECLAVATRIQPRGPYALFGYSFGGCIALEMARQFRAKGEEVAYLGLAEPSLHPRFWPVRAWLETASRRLAASASSSEKAPRERGAPASDRPNRIPQLADRNSFSFRKIQRRLTYLSGTTRGTAYRASPYYLDGFPPKFQAVRDRDLIALASYNPRPLDQLTYFYRSPGGDALTCPPESMWPRILPALYWSAVPGDHASMIRPQHVQQLARAIAVDLAESGKTDRRPGLSLEAASR